MHAAAGSQLAVLEPCQFGSLAPCMSASPEHYLSRNAGATSKLQHTKLNSAACMLPGITACSWMFRSLLHLSMLSLATRHTLCSWRRAVLVCGLLGTSVCLVCHSHSQHADSKP